MKNPTVIANFFGVEGKQPTILNLQIAMCSKQGRDVRQLRNVQVHPKQIVLNRAE